MKLRFAFPLEDERKAALLSAFFLFCILSAFILLKSGRDAFFLSHYTSRELPYMMTINTVASALAAVFFLRLYRFFSLARVTRFSLIAFIIGTLLLWKGIELGVHRIRWIIYLWVGIFGTIAPVQGWALVALQFSTRQAKRAMGVIGGGAILGAIAGGFLAKILGGSEGAQLLLPCSALFIFLALLVCLTLSSEAPTTDEVPAPAEQQYPIRKHFMILLLLVVATGTIVSAFVDYQFKTFAQREFHSAESLAAFFGSFYAYMGVATLIFQIAGTPFLMRRLGVAATLSFLPLSLFISNAAILLTGLFISAVLMRGSEELFRHSVDRSSLEVLYVAMPQHLKVRVKSLIDTVGVRVPEGIASLLLIAMFSLANVPVSSLVFINGALLLFWILCTFLLGKREYPLLLKEEIQRKEIDMEAVKANLFTMDFYRLLPELLRNGERQTVVDLLELLETSGKEWLGRYLTVALARDEPEIRLKALQLLFYQNVNASAQVHPLLQDKEGQIRREAVHYFCLHSKPPKKLLQNLLKDEDLAVQVAVEASWLKKKVLQESGFEKLEELRQASLTTNNIEARKEIAHVLEFVNSTKATLDLYSKLLSDPSLEVRRAALKGIAHSHPPGLIKPLLRLMRSPELVADVRATLARYGPTLLPHLSRLLEDKNESVVRKKVALYVAADIGAARAVPLVISAAKDANLTIRFSAIKALNRLNKHQGIVVPRPVILELLEKEIAAMEFEMRRSETFATRPNGLLANVLRQRTRAGFERIFRLLGLLYDQSSIYYTYLAWNSNEQRLTDAALEFLEQAIEPQMRQKLFPLLEAFSLASEGESDPEKRKDAALSLFQEGEPLLSAATISDLTPEEIDEWLPEILQSLGENRNHPLVLEALERRRKKMAKKNESKTQPLSTIQKMESLAKIDIFSQLGSHELLLLADQSVEVEFKEGESIFGEGEIARDAFTLIEGKVELVRASKPLATVGPGESFGTLELLSNQPRLFSACAFQDCFCLKIDREIFWEILEDYPAVSRAILEVLVQQIRVLTDRIADSVSI